MGTFEGYVGIRLWDGQLVDDVVFSLLFVLFMCFKNKERKLKNMERVTEKVIIQKAKTYLTKNK